MEYFINGSLPSNDELIRLYSSVGWDIYVKNNKDMQLLLANSYIYASAYEGNCLVGLCRVISDGISIAYIQDILVDPIFQDKGVGSELLKLISNELSTIRQIVLITDTKTETLKFYEKNQLKKLQDFECTGFMRINE